jgi:hypothetical protein
MGRPSIVSMRSETEREEQRAVSMLRLRRADLPPAQQENFTQIPQRQPVARTAENHETDDLACQAGPIQYAPAPLVNRRPQSRQRNRR